MGRRWKRRRVRRDPLPHRIGRCLQRHLRERDHAARELATKLDARSIGGLWLITVRSARFAVLSCQWRASLGSGFVVGSIMALSLGDFDASNVAYGFVWSYFLGRAVGWSGGFGLGGVVANNGGFGFVRQY
jgi:hypothetical protein